MQELTVTRLYILRGAYLIIAVGLGAMVWPRLLDHSAAWALKFGDAMALLAGVQVMAMIGIRYPVRMLPLLLFEFTWKSIWLLTIALPLWRAGPVDAATAASIEACGVGVAVCLVAIPWRYVATHFVAARGEPWGRRPIEVATASRPAPESRRS